jgi:hypothetical protein
MVQVLAVQALTYEQTCDAYNLSEKQQITDW